MSGGQLGGGVIFVIAALLWTAVLVPSWIRRREFTRAEQNAIRLQRTLRVLAETAEVPEEVRVEATAREAVAHERLVRTAQKRQEAERRARLAEAKAEQARAEIRAQQMKRKQLAVKRAARLRRPIARRVRATSALAALLGIIGVLIGAGVAFAGQGAVLLVWSAMSFVLGSGALVLLAPGRAKSPTTPAERAVEEVVDQVSAPEPPVVAEDERARAYAQAQAQAAARIARARALARARAERPAPRSNQPDSILLEEGSGNRSEEPTGGNGAEEAARPASPAASERQASEQPAAAPSPVAAADSADFSAMGRIGDTSRGMPDLDEVLRRRRSAG